MHTRLFDLRRAGFSMLAAVPLAFLAGTAFAQQPPPPQEGQQPPPQQQTPPPQQPPAAEVDDTTLDQFVDAFSEVQAIQAEASEELQQAGDEAAAREIQQEAQERMVEAVIDSGLSVEEYNQVAQLMNTDPEVREDVMERLDQEGASSGMY